MTCYTRLGIIKSKGCFLSSVLPLFHGPFVKIRIDSSDIEYTVSKPLLCRESTYFSAMFDGEFSEGQEQTATLEEIEGVVSARSLEALLQWLYLRRVRFDLKETEDQISAAIELVRLSDMCNITGVESHMAQYIKDILIANPKPRPSPYEKWLDTTPIRSHRSTLFLRRSCLGGMPSVAF